VISDSDDEDSVVIITKRKSYNQKKKEEIKAAYMNLCQSNDNRKPEECLQNDPSAPDRKHGRPPRNREVGPAARVVGYHTPLVYTWAAWVLYFLPPPLSTV